MPEDTQETPAPQEERSPRAFAHATGLVFVIAGSGLALAACCWWPITSWTEDELPTRSEGRLVVPDIGSDASPAQIWAMIALPASFLAGLGLAVVGLGLYLDRLRTGRAALALTGLLAVFFWCYLGFAIFQFPAAGRIIVAALGALLWTAGFLLAGAAADELKRCPPPRRSEPAWTSRDEDALRRALSPRSPGRTSPSGRSDPPA